MHICVPFIGLPQGLNGKSKLEGVYWSVSDHHKASPKPILFWKHQCALIDHKIFMKQIGSIVVILNHFKRKFGGHFLFFVSCIIIIFFFHKEKLSCNADIEMP